MTEAQIQLQNALTTTFLANMAFLSEYDNELYHKVDELSCMIASGSYKEKYELEFITEDGDFDIYDVINDKYLYNRKPKKINSDLIRKSELDTNNSIFNISEYFFLKENLEIDRNNRFNFNDLKELTALTLNDMSEYSKLLKDSLEDKKKLKYINKFIFLGTLLGRHIPKIEKKIDADLYLVLERNLEIFRLSLFTTDYSILAKKGVVFSIMDNDQIEKSKIDFFLDKGFFYNYLIKFSSTTINIDKYIDNFLSILNTKKPTLYDYNRLLYVHINRTTRYIKDGYKTLLLDKIKDKCNIFENIPILYIAAGPSLDENIEWIKENQNKFFIVAIGAIYKRLLDYNICINIIITFDEQEFLNDIQFDDESVSKIGKDTIILASTITNNKILKKLSHKNLFLYEVFSSIYKNNLSVSGFSIGELVLDILIKLNSKNVYLIGLDFSLNQKTGDSHSSDSSSGITKLDLMMEQDREDFNSRESLIKVKGNLLENVFTTPLFFNSIQSAEVILSYKSDNMNFFNLSENGAFIKNTIPLKINELNIKEFTNIPYYCINDDFLIFLNANSLNELSNESILSINNEIFFLKNEISNLLNKIKNTKIFTFDELLKNIYQVYELTYDYKNINKIIENYFKMITAYLYYHFNDLKLKNENKKVNKVKEIFIYQIENLIIDYITCLKRVN
ncbi:motility associated factor glycosyltransferase family protein [Aliarcobacter cryaerophilus]|uniref:6-hydroxymethylpterin diphosphokinase MptE-like protein n=1 Tax=Aliarcobacter cryaerophilus TaxID=28198 RepID=UPI00164A4E30|nr:6-hydroxymethylpterin diphosphokinase MptE-like protein [Aliarcobacter cryaerophilus]QNK85155.1 motility associated factor glycosyltransferase family protein [Aliarcobacter cryaerophilus]